MLLLLTYSPRMSLRYTLRLQSFLCYPSQTAMAGDGMSPVVRVSFSVGEFGFFVDGVFARFDGWDGDGGGKTVPMVLGACGAAGWSGAGEAGGVASGTV